MAEGVVARTLFLSSQPQPETIIEAAQCRSRCCSVSGGNTYRRSGALWSSGLMCHGRGKADA
ncbi:unnamed protein product, partial [Brassica rapa]